MTVINRINPVLALIAASLMLLAMQPALAQSDNQASSSGQQLSLQTENAEEGFALALTLARTGVTATQTEKEVLHGLRPEYSNNPDSLIAASHVVAVHFQTIAAANDYWRD